MKSFEKVYTQGNIDLVEIWLDKETGVSYMFQKNANSGDITQLLDKDGKPVVPQA